MHEQVRAASVYGRELIVFLARRNLFQDTTRLALSISGVALAVMLILLLRGFLGGMYRQIAAYLERTPGSVVVAQEDVTNLLGATSLLPPGTGQRQVVIDNPPWLAVAEMLVRKL